MNFIKKNINTIIIILIFFLSLIYLTFGLNFNLQEVFNSSSNLNQIILKFRLPRIFLALVVGASLATSGLVFQGLLRNPLAEPYTLGISGSVVLFVNISMILNQDSKFLFLFNTFFGIIFSILIIYFIFLKKRFSIYQILLAGIMINIICLAIVELLSYFIDYSKIYMSKSWLIGNLSGNVDYLFYLMAVVIVLGIIFCYKKSDVIDILSLGETHASFLGINVKKEQRLLFLTASIIAGISVAYTGIIGFIGLMIPHIIRIFIGGKTKSIIIPTALFGAFYLLFSDFVAKNILYPTEIPVGVITSFIGGIFFIFFISRKGIYENE